MTRTTILLMPSHTLAWLGLRTALYEHSAPWVIKSADSPAEALTIAAHDQPPVILIAADQHPEMVRPLLRDLPSRSPHSRLVLLGTDIALQPHWIEARTQIAAYLNWQMLSASSILPIITAISQERPGGEHITHRIDQRVELVHPPLPPGLADSSPSLATLSPREADVLALVASSARYKQVAQRLRLTVNTVKSHMANIRARWNLATTNDVIRVYQRSDQFRVVDQPTNEG